MKGKNSTYILFIILGLLLALGSYVTSILTDYKSAYRWIELGLQISMLAGLIMLVRNGTFIKSKYFKILQGVFGILFLGIIFKILHWPYANLITIVSFSGVIIVYLFSFLNKPIKKRLDYLKFLWVVSQYSIGSLLFLHMIGDAYRILPTVIMWLMIIDYLKTENENKRFKA